MASLKAHYVDATIIQICQVDDAPRLAPLVAALAREEGTEPVEYDRLTAIIRRLIDTSSSDFLLATHNDQPVGCLQISWRLSTWHGADYAYLEDVYVVPAWRCCGIGRRMLMKATALAEVKGADQMMLDVRIENSAAQRLYEHSGFNVSDSILMKRAIIEYTIDEKC